MTTTDTDALQERIERELFLSERWNWYDDRTDIKKTPEGDREQREKMAALWDADVRKPLHESIWPGFRQTYSRRAAAVLPLVDAAVKRGKAEALRSAANDAREILPDAEGGGLGGNEWFPEEWGGQVEGWLNYRAHRIEKETPDEQ